jgi:hypothetical protein
MSTYHKSALLKQLSNLKLYNHDDKKTTKFNLSNGILLFQSEEDIFIEVD